MTRAEKTATIEALKEKLQGVEYFYLADSSTLTVEEINNFRRKCFEEGVEMKVVKNTLLQKAFEASPDEMGYERLYDALVGPTAILIADVANKPARIIKEFRKEHEKPVLKAAYIESEIFEGDE
ncbi:MAG: 50S ribosomal protein L10, partial [Saprospiraceae bacterium]|nr:50S ribosomal protein L10 [Saprospiraceae bacterium]